MSNITCGMACIANFVFRYNDSCVRMLLYHSRFKPIPQAYRSALKSQPCAMCFDFHAPLGNFPKSSKQNASCNRDTVGQVVPLYRHTTIYLLGTHSRDPCNWTPTADISTNVMKLWKFHVCQKCSVNLTEEIACCGLTYHYVVCHIFHYSIKM